jgi:SAM-dependent methyltransferase
MINPLRELWIALRHPARAPTDTSMLRAFLAKPRIYDLVSTYLQLRQLARVAAVRQPNAEDDSNVARTIRKNHGQIVRKPITRTRRVEPFYRIAATPYRDVSKERVLIVGGRAIAEFYAATFSGFRWENLVGVDLFSAHPKILTMDMHKLEFPDASFDVVTMINVLGYSETFDLAIGQAMRVLKPGGRFVFSHAYLPKPEGPQKTSNLPVATIIASVRAHGGRVYFHECEDKINSRGDPQGYHMIGVRKVAGLPPPLDGSAP